MLQRQILLSIAAAYALGALHLAAAHGHEEELGMDMDMGAVMHTNSSMNSTRNSTLPIWEGWEPSYFRHGAYSHWMTLHILAMIASWMLVMPVALMLSVARSRYSLIAQIVFHAVNGLGIFAGFVYNQSTPDLYVVNAHHPLGWAVQVLTVVWTLLSICTAFNDWQKRKSDSQSYSTAGRPLLHSPPSGELRPYADRPSLSRFSQDSGNYTNSRNGSYDSTKDEEQPLSPGSYDGHVEVDLSDQHDEKLGFSGNGKLDRLLAKHARHISSTGIATAIRFVQIVLEKFLLLLGFAALVTGFVTYGGIFRGQEVFSGAAHYVKGAIFFWYGLLTLGRWMGAFAEFGWAWNLRPQQPIVSRWKTLVPSAEFTESFVIWFYGASNVFLEHLGATDSTWGPQDFEHVSITVLFFGGGLFGMLVEQKWLRKLMSTQVEVQKSKDANNHGTSARLTAIGENRLGQQVDEWTQPATEKISLNPMPAVTIMLLGMMMSGHHQQSMVSTMMHKQWGMLFSGFAMSRLATYVITYLKPPTSYYPSRPPTELIAAFCLCSGGILFMNSARDSVRSIETNGLDAMTIFTIAIGLTGLIMAWAMICYGVKGLAQRKERLAAGKPLP